MSGRRDLHACLRLGVVVPCRNEAAVIERKLKNLLWLEWPPAQSGRQHRLIVVDDSSADGTAERARALLERSELPEGVVAEVISSTARPGKCEAVRQALGRIEEEVDLIVLTDADVILRRPALRRLAWSFSINPRLQLACGAQEFVHDLAPDGACHGRDGGEPMSATSLYDSLSDRVRVIESKLGRLFSVHGQLLAWRARRGLRPSPGIAADDLDLMHQARSVGGRVERLPHAAFLEVRTPVGGAQRTQAQRRARAFFQFLRARPETPRRDLLTRVQWAFYRSVPRYFLELILLAAVLVVLAFVLLWGPYAGLALLGLGALAFFGGGRRLLAFVATLRSARSEDSFEQLTDRWEMQRP